MWHRFEKGLLGKIFSGKKRSLNQKRPMASSRHFLSIRNLQIVSQFIIKVCFQMLLGTYSLPKSDFFLQQQFWNFGILPRPFWTPGRSSKRLGRKKLFLSARRRDWVITYKHGGEKCTWTGNQFHLAKTFNCCQQCVGLSRQQNGGMDALVWQSSGLNRRRST